MLSQATPSFGSCAGFAALTHHLLPTRSPSLLPLPPSNNLKGFGNNPIPPLLKSSNTLSLSLKTSVAVDPNLLASSDPTTTTTHKEQVAKKYYFVVANAKFMLDEEEHFSELLAERLRYYGERNKEQDFWLVVEPKFLDQFPYISKRLKRPAVALVSTNGTWITFMKLRLDRVLSESYEANSLEEALASNPTELEFKKPESWVAPYPKYEFGWWEPFLPPRSDEPKA